MHDSSMIYAQGRTLNRAHDAADGWGNERRATDRAARPRGLRKRRCGRAVLPAAGRGSPPPPAPPIVLSQIPGVVSPSPLGWIARRRNRLARRWLAASPNLRGSIYLFSSMLVYAVMVGGMKHIGGTIPLAEILMIRQIIMTLVIVAIARGALPMLLRTTRPGLQVTRGVITLISMLCGFWALIHIPLAQATAIGFSQVFFVTIAAVIILKERVDARRWVATIVGFGGVMVMLDPTTERAQSLCAGGNRRSVLRGAGEYQRAPARGDRAHRDDPALSGRGADGGAGGAVLVVLGRADANQWFWLVTLSLFGTAGQWLMTRAYQVGEAAALAPLDFSRLSCWPVLPASSSSVRSRL
jgi:drug/metabolite transporter (DMT)-like permease